MYIQVGTGLVNKESEQLPLLLDTSSSIEVRRRPETSWKIWKNVLALVGGAGIFTMGLNPIDDLQSSINSSGGLGVASLSVKYAFMILGNLFINTLVIKRLGSKAALVCGTILYGAYIVANFYPTWATLIPMTIVAGLGGALLWTTLGHFLASLAHQLALATDRSPDATKALFFGLKNIVSNAFAALGGVASSVILGTGVYHQEIFRNSSVTCGAGYCNQELSGGVSDESGVIETTTLYMLCCFCMAAAILAVLVQVVFVDPLRQKVKEHLEDEEESPLAHLLATVRLWEHKEQLLLIPVTFVYGFQEAFWRVEFTKAYVTCAIGIEHIGFLMVCYNVASLLSSFVCGWLGQQRHRLVAFPVVAVTDMTVLAAMLFWSPTSSDASVSFVVVAAVTGTTYGALSTMLLTFYGIVFPEDLEAAYSNLYFWSFLGSTLLYAFSYSLCIWVKVLVVFSTIALGLLGYVATELVLVRKSNGKSLE